MPQFDALLRYGRPPAPDIPGSIQSQVKPYVMPDEQAAYDEGTWTQVAPTQASVNPTEQITLDPPVQPDQIDLEAKAPAQIPDGPVAERRAIKANVAFGAESPGADQLLAEIRSGNEQMTRRRLAIGKDIALREIRRNMIYSVAEEKAKKGEAITQEEANFIASLSQEQLNHDPATIFETEYARQFFNQQTLMNGGNNPIAKGVQKDPEATHEELDVASGIKSRMEIAKTVIEGLDTRWKNSSWGSALANYAGRFIPLLETIRLGGTNLEDRVQRYWTLPPDQFKAQLEKDVSELEASNPLTAMRFAHAVLSYSSSDKFLDNVFGIADITGIPGITIGKLAAKGARAVAQRVGEKALAGTNVAIEAERQAVKGALKEGVKADNLVQIKPLEDMVAQVGDNETAAKLSAYKEAVSLFTAKDELRESSRLTREVPLLFNVRKVMEGSENLDREASARLFNQALDNATKLITSFSNTSSVARLEEGSDALRIAVEKGWENLKTSYPHLNDAVLEMNRVKAEDLNSNVHMAEMQLGKSAKVASELRLPPKPVEPKTGSGEVVPFPKQEKSDLGFDIVFPEKAKVVQLETSIGKPDATLFTGDRGKQEAEYWAMNIYKLDPNAYRVKQKGHGWYISVRGPVSEVEDLTRDALITTGHETPKGVFNTFLGRLRSAEDILSESNRKARHVATHGAQELHRLATSTADQIGQLNRKSIQRLDAFLAANRDETYTEKGLPKRGVFYQNVGEFDRAWTSFHLGKAPTDQERSAYFAAVQLNDWDYMFRNLGLFRDKSRLGIENFAFWHQVADETTGQKAFVKSLPTEGRRVKDIPWNDKEDAGIWVYDGKTNTHKYYDKNSIKGSQEHADILNKINTEGYHVIQVANPIDKPLRKIADNEEAIHFMVVPNSERTPLSWKQLDYRPGGHVEYKYENWTKQPIIRRTQDGRQVYEGDQSIFNHATEAEARKFSKAMDTARILLRDNKIDELEKFLPANLPYDLNAFTALFKKGVAADGTAIEPRLSLSDPIRHTVSSRNMIDAHPDIALGYDKFTNQVRSSYNLYGLIDKKFASSRDETLMTVRERTAGSNELFRLEKSKLINPLNTLNRAMANIMRGRYLADYKHKSVEEFIQEFGDLFKIEGVNPQEVKDTIRKNPVYYLHNPPWDTQTPNKELLAAGMNAQRAIISLLGTESELGQNLGWAQRRLMDFIYNKAGQKVSDYVADHMLPVIQDPFRYARAVAFHSKLGLFNPVQLFLQAQTLTHVTAVAGFRAGYQGMSAAGLMWRLGLNENKQVVEHFAQIATKFGWKKEDFLESYYAMKKAGIHNVEGEYALRDDVFEPKLFKGAAGQFLDKGTFFFREGERLTRLTAWNAAYHEWKVANPGKILDNAALSDILLRQNTLSVNMTRASSAWWQQGILSVPTQFWAYQARLMEQLVGKRLTDAERARALLTYSAMYGVPTATGAATFAYPWYEDMRQSALERGIDLTSPGHKAIMEGIPSMIWTMITGNEQNFAQRLGPGGIPTFKDVFHEGKVIEAFGAAPKIITDMVGAISPIFKGIVSSFVPGMADWKLTGADLIRSMKEISTINNVGKAIYALNTGKFISKNEIDLGPATPLDALMTTMVGTQPLRETDAFLTGDMANEIKSLQDSAKKEIVKNWRRALKEFDAGNDSAAHDYMNNMRNQIVGAGFRPDQLQQVLREAVDGHEDLIEKMKQKYLKSAPADQYQQRFNTLFKIKPEEK